MTNWKIGTEYEQKDPGYYVSDVDTGLIVFVFDEDEVLPTAENIEKLEKLIQDAKFVERVNAANRGNEVLSPEMAERVKTLLAMPMHLDGGMIHLKACMQWVAYYTWETLHTSIYRHGDWFTDLSHRLKDRTRHFHDHVEIKWIYLHEIHRITFHFRPLRGAGSYTIFLRLDKPLNEAIWARRAAPYDPDDQDGVWGVDELFAGFDYRHLPEAAIDL